MAPLAHMDEALETALEQGGRWMVAPLAHEEGELGRKRTLVLDHDLQAAPLARGWQVVPMAHGKRASDEQGSRPFGVGKAATREHDEVPTNP